MRSYAIGDIHGHIDLLKQVHELKQRLEVRKDVSKPE